MTSKLEPIVQSTFEVHSLSGEIQLRLSLGLVLFFGRGMDQFGKQILALWNDLLAWRGRDVYTWARLGGGNKSRKADAATYRTIQSWLDGTKPSGDTCWIQIHGGDYEALGPDGFSVTGVDPTDRFVSSVDVRLPLDLLQQSAGDADTIAKRLCDLAGHVDFLCGTAGLMLEATPFGREDLWPRMKALVTRYEGVEPDMVEDGEATAEHGLTGINWLTFIGAKYVEQLGGSEHLKAGARASELGVTSIDVGRGLALRAGAWPRLGDRNVPSRDLDPYRAVYKLVKPAIFADPKYPFDNRYFGGDETVEWMHRFDKP